MTKATQTQKQYGIKWPDSTTSWYQQSELATVLSDDSRDSFWMHELFGGVSFVVRDLPDNAEVFDV